MSQSEMGIMKVLNEVLVPGVMRSLVQMNLVKSVELNDGKAGVTLASAAIPDQYLSWLKEKVAASINGLPEVKEATVDFVEAKPKELNQIRCVVAVMSGKGGVGKSLVASLLATSFAREGSSVGILDADITGSSIPKIFGLSAHPSGSESGILPILSKTGIEIMSMNLLLPKEDDAVIWRGPIIARSITQFWEDVLWGKLDYLLVDMPPGTADVPLTVMQSIPLSGVIMAFTPQDLTAMVVRKAVKMAQQMKKPILGVVENMSYLYVPEIDKKIELFGRSHGEEMAQSAGAPLLGQLPIDPALAKLCDEGNIERYDAEVIKSLGEYLSQADTTGTEEAAES